MLKSNFILNLVGGEKGQMLHVKKNKKVLPREKIAKIFDENSETLELGLQTGLSQSYGDIPGASAITGMILT